MSKLDAFLAENWPLVSGAIDEDALIEALREHVESKLAPKPAFDKIDAFSRYFLDQGFVPDDIDGLEKGAASYILDAAGDATLLSKRGLIVSAYTAFMAGVEAVLSRQSEQHVQISGVALKLDASVVAWEGDASLSHDGAFFDLYDSPLPFSGEGYRVEVEGTEKKRMLRWIGTAKVSESGVTVDVVGALPPSDLHGEDVRLRILKPLSQVSGVFSKPGAPTADLTVFPEEVLKAAAGQKFPFKDEQGAVIGEGTMNGDGTYTAALWDVRERERRTKSTLQIEDLTDKVFHAHPAAQDAEATFASKLIAKRLTALFEAGGPSFGGVRWECIVDERDFRRGMIFLRDWARVNGVTLV